MQACVTDTSRPDRFSEKLYPLLFLTTGSGTPLGNAYNAWHGAETVNPMVSFPGREQYRTLAIWMSIAMNMRALITEAIET